MPLGSVKTGQSQGGKAEACAWVGVSVNSLQLTPGGVNKSEKRSWHNLQLEQELTKTKHPRTPSGALAFGAEQSQSRETTTTSQGFPQTPGKHPWGRGNWRRRRGSLALQRLGISVLAIFPDPTLAGSPSPRTCAVAGVPRGRRLCGREKPLWPALRKPAREGSDRCPVLLSRCPAPAQAAGVRRSRGRSWTRRKWVFSFPGIGRTDPWATPRWGRE